MSLTIAELDRMSPSDAEAALEACCGSRAWLAGMVVRRPFRSIDRVLAASDAVAEQLGPDDWLQAFAHHPRIGEQHAKAAVPAGARAWSASEQSTATSAPDDIRRALAEANRAYEARFGFIFIICASGRSAPEILAALDARLENDRATEITVAAAEQRKIAGLRLARLLTPDTEQGG